MSCSYFIFDYYFDFDLIIIIALQVGQLVTNYVSGTSFIIWKNSVMQAL